MSANKKNRRNFETSIFSLDSPHFNTRVDARQKPTLNVLTAWTT